MKISEHCFLRYAQRVQKKDDVGDANAFAMQHRDDITKWLEELVASCEAIYTGPLREFKDPITYLVNKDGWVLLVSKDDTLVTLYRVDLEVDDEELNKSYVEKALAKIAVEQKAYNESCALYNEEMQKRRDAIAANNNKMSDYQKMIAQLKAENEALEKLNVSGGSVVSEKRMNLKNALENYLLKDVNN